MQPESTRNAAGEVPRTLPAELLKPTYQNRLRSIGRELDLSNSRSIIILEVDGGFILRAVSREDSGIDLQEFTDASYAERMIQATEARGQGERPESPSQIAPTGYEDLLRAVGRLLDERHASGIVVAEKLKSLIVTGDQLAGNRSMPFDEEFDETGITELLDEAFRLRSGGK